MSEETARELRALCCQFEQWAIQATEESSKEWDTFGDNFYSSVKEAV